MLRMLRDCLGLAAVFALLAVAVCWEAVAVLVWTHWPPYRDDDEDEGGIDEPNLGPREADGPRRCCRRCARPHELFEAREGVHHGNG